MINYFSIYLLLIILGIILFLLTSIIINAIHKKNILNKKLIREKPVPIFLLLLMHLVLSLSLFDVLKIFFSEKVTLLDVAEITKISTSVCDFTDAYYTSDNLPAGTYYTPSDTNFNSVIFKKEKHKYLEYHTNIILSTIKPSPFISAPLITEKGIITVKNAEGKSYIVISNSKTNFILKDKINKLSFFNPAPAPDGIYFNINKNGFYNINFYSYDQAKIIEVQKPEKYGHFYDPFYWDRGQVLFYTGIVRNKQQTYINSRFEYRLYMKYKENPAFAHNIGFSDTMKLKPFRVDGNANGKYFAHTVENKNFITIYNMNYYPFKINSDFFAKFYGFFTLMFPGITEIQSITFHPNQPLTLLICARRTRTYNNSIFEIKLKENTTFIYRPGKLSYVYIILSIIFSILLIVFIIRKWIIPE